MLPIDALGVVMVAHGEEFGTDSAFGRQKHLSKSLFVLSNG